ncbi:BZ3500_MvSof-1268-A1-R1_Chr2-1g04702 [Microbotryum saponariae]|uniref:BZ3500_MvSof-1268-A1-R1_Chr2-1g04702 protein n=1 Tax=Microbotryum saponariae TaxID=289078 RepID=A0A2X0KKT1_9BASI|nr:BZ3500_MvSof-1268-A1-R1_Chr2-1g04702 [Microbotryum saponariae]SCZ92358.1 BZ3501_MvSof-1269-A2-R1_Chr2-1g04358 [Microbotryum saponariae]
MQSFSLTTFSPSGKLIQIEHALAAVGQGTTSLGIKASVDVTLVVAGVVIVFTRLDPRPRSITWPAVLTTAYHLFS